MNYDQAKRSRRKKANEMNELDVNKATNIEENV